MSKVIRYIALFAGAVAVRAESLDAILARMDAAAKTFKSVTANLKQIEYTAVIKDSVEESGVLKIKRDSKSIMAITEYTKPEVHWLLLRDKKAQVYSPKAKMVQVYDHLAKYMATADQFVLLAFGASGAELLKNYEVKLGGAETIESTATTRIDLIPRSDEVKKLFTKFELWIPEGQANAIREKVSSPSGDYYLLEYSNVKLNAPLTDSVFDLKLPKDVKFVYPQH